VLFAQSHERVKQPERQGGHKSKISLSRGTRLAPLVVDAELEIEPDAEAQTPVEIAPAIIAEQAASEQVVSEQFLPSMLGMMAETVPTGAVPLQPAE
jgi:hypothetical protein